VLLLASLPHAVGRELNNSSNTLVKFLFTGKVFVTIIVLNFLFV
jgi:hypothetical protein